MRKLILFTWLGVILNFGALAQTQNTIHVDQWTPGATVGDKVNYAQSLCLPDASVPCYIMIEAPLARWDIGTMPDKCANCVWMDYRAGLPQQSGNLQLSGAQSTGPTSTIPTVIDYLSGVSRFWSAGPNPSTHGGIDFWTCNSNGFSCYTPMQIRKPDASVAGVTIKGTPYTAGTATTNYPVLAVWTDGAAEPSTWSTTGTMFGVNAPSGFNGRLLDMHVNGGVSVFSIGYNGSGAFSSTVSSATSVPQALVAASGGVVGKALGGVTAATVAAAAAAGTTPSIACAASHVCTFPNGTVSLTTVAGTTTGALLTVTTTLTHTNLPDCTAQIALAASPYTAITNYQWSYTTTVATLNVGTALTAPATYTITYQCLGY